MATWPYRGHIDANIRRRFDELLEAVLDELPPRWGELLEQVPLVVEDRPSRRIAREMELEGDDDLCGLYTGIPLTERSVEQSGVMPDEILIFRMGILAESADDADRISNENLKRQIRITVLHEMGHHFGLEEEALKELGYE